MSSAAAARKADRRYHRAARAPLRLQLAEAVRAALWLLPPSAFGAGLSDHFLQPGLLQSAGKVYPQVAVVGRNEDPIGIAA
jgi:hypothetical protein